MRFSNLKLEPLEDDVNDASFKKGCKPMLFYKILYFLKFYHCVHEIRTAYNSISCHDMYGISDKSNDIFNYHHAKMLDETPVPISVRGSTLRVTFSTY